MYIKKYLELLECEIEEMIQLESEGLTVQGESELHKLLENRKHAKELCEEMRASKEYDVPLVSEG